MWDSPLLPLIGGLIGFIATIIVSIIGYLIKNRLESYETQRMKLEGKLDRYITDLRNEVDGVEKTSLQIQNDLYKKFGELPKEFVPRAELKEIVNGIRVAATINSQTVEKLEQKIDKVLMVLAGGE